VFGSPRRVLGALFTTTALGALVTLISPMAAQASLIDLSACDSSALSQPFVPWADLNQYKLAPGADFEGSLDGWSLQGGAAATSGSESFGVTGSVGTSSLALPSGATATSPATCVNAAYPSFRLFTRTDTPGATVTVSVVYGSGLGRRVIPVGLVTPAGSWQPTLPMLTGSAVPGLLNGGDADISLRFSASGGTVQIDDAYVDPHGRCC
jgi:hypothetical protein